MEIAWVINMNQELKLASQPKCIYRYMTELFSYHLCCSCFNAVSISFAPLGPLQIFHNKNDWNVFILHISLCLIAIHYPNTQHGCVIGLPSASRMHSSTEMVVVLIVVLVEVSGLVGLVVLSALRLVYSCSWRSFACC